MKTLGHSIGIVLWVWLLAPYSAFALTIGYDIQIQNELSTPVKVEISQYRAEGFDGTRPIHPS